MTVISENTKFSLSPKNFFTIIVLIGSMVGMYYSLQAQIEEAKEFTKAKSTSYRANDRNTKRVGLY